MAKAIQYPLDIPLSYAPESCPRYRGCIAPLCPLDKSIPAPAIWSPSEAICHSRQFRAMHIIKTQLQIQIKALDKESFYTARMLSAIQIVSQELTGIAPEDPWAERNWLARLRYARNKGRKTSQKPTIAGEISYPVQELKPQQLTLFKY